MPFTLPNPVVIDGVEYPYAGVSLITSPGFGETSVSARVVFSLEPYRIDAEGKIQRPMISLEAVDEDGRTYYSEVPDQSKTITKVYANAYLAAAANPNLAQALVAVSSGIQGFINAEF